MCPPIVPASACLLALLIAPAARADTATLTPVADTALFEREASFNFGAQEDIPAGTLLSGDLARALFRFDVAGALPPGAVISIAQLRLRIFRQATAAQQGTFALSRMLVPWSEGSGSSPIRPGGAPALAGEPSWLQRAAPSAPWAVPGGALEEEISDDPASIQNIPPVAGVTVSFPFNAQGIADLTDMLANPSSNFGWILYDLGEGEGVTGRRFVARESPTHPPELRITFTLPEPPPTPTITSILLEPGVLNITFSAEPGIAYTLEANASLDPETWIPGETLPPDAGAGERTFTVTNPPSGRHFYRISAASLFL